jgi:hypothetical protein
MRHDILSTTPVCFTEDVVSKFSHLLRLQTQILKKGENAVKHYVLESKLLLFIVKEVFH